MNNRLTLLFLLIPVLVIAGILGIPGAPDPERVKLENDRADLDSARRANFLACLKENSEDEQACLEKMGIHAWYPSDEKDCVAVATRIDKVFAAQGLPRWPDLFRNERCARLGMPHHEEAAAAGTIEFEDRSYAKCYNIDYMAYTCDDIHGRHRRFRDSEKECRAIGDLAFDYPAWELVFENERCWRLGMPHRESE